MKLDPVFLVKENQLCSLEGSKVEFKFTDVKDIDNLPACDGSIYKIILEQKVIEPETESYNEEFLAKLRDVLKSFEDKQLYAVIEMVPSKAFDETITDSFEYYVACLKHTTRRIKDCTNLAGVYFNAEFEKSAADKIFYAIDELVGKHAQYVYFADATLFDKAASLTPDYLEKIVRC